MTDEEKRNPASDERDNDCRELIHVHNFMSVTLAVDGHSHGMTGVSAPARRNNSSHIHRIKGRTTYDSGHWHAYDVFTGPAVPMPDGMHTHYFEGVTTEAQDHVHEFTDVVGLSPDVDGLLGSANPNKYKPR